MKAALFEEIRVVDPSIAAAEYRRLGTNAAWVEWQGMNQAEGRDGAVLIRFSVRGLIENHTDSQLDSTSS